ncbi:MAG TPA: glyceraldehyde 3-phosphate dehydrogenase NAD-binding domain-containing protein [Spirochaetia bacterium]|nr:glyceraldehyde 3-phosphate dehydrogenase NAD-binding domain-containing protein [Spirochaetia bacterium]
MGSVGIYGFGRIGRTFLRVALEKKLFVPSHIGDIKDPAAMSALFEVDTNYGRWPEPVSFAEGRFRIGDRQIAFVDTHTSVPDWGALGVDVVVDCSGRATRRENAKLHLDRGAKKVLVSAGSKSLSDCDAVLLPGINLESYDPKKHHIISMGSCTTNALAPVVKILKENVGIAGGFFSTVHSYTNTQSLTDQPMADRRDSWAAAENIIPSSSGAAKVLLFIWPNLPVTGKAYRVPTRTGSIVELVATVEQATSAESVKGMFRRAADSPSLRGILGILEQEYASSRIVGDSHSSIIDLPLISVMGDRLVSVAAWYDNEFGFSTRLAETAKFLGS